MNKNKGNRAAFFIIILMWISCIIFYGYQYFLQVSPSVLANQLMKDFNINATALGFLVSCYFYSYSLMQIPVGLILDRLGSRLPLTICALICASSCLLFSTTHNFYIAAIGRIMIGIGGSFAFVGSLYVCVKSLPKRVFALFSGATVTIGMIGAIFSQTIFVRMANSTGWRSAMFFFFFCRIFDSDVNFFYSKR